MNAIEDNNYKKWLLLLKSHPKAPFTPTKQIDESWHQHLKSSMYEVECHQLIGFVPKHLPCFDDNELEEGFKMLTSKWRQAYGEMPSGAMAVCRIDV